MKELCRRPGRSALGGSAASFAITLTLTFCLSQNPVEAAQTNATGTRIDTVVEVITSSSPSPSDTASIRLLQWEARAILERLDRCGYPLATVRLDSLRHADPDSGGAFAWIEETGPPVNLLEARFRGHRRLTDEQVLAIYRAEIGGMAIKANMMRQRSFGCAPYGRLLERAVAGMQTRSVLEDVSLLGWEVMAYEDADDESTSAVPVFSIRETSASTFQGIVGMGEASGGGVVWMGEAKLGIPMLIHPGWSLESSFRRTSEVFSLDVRTGWQRMFGLPFDLQTSFESFQRESSYLDQSLAVELDWHGRGILGVSTGWRRRMLRFGEGRLTAQDGNAVEGGDIPMDAHGSIAQNVLSAGIHLKSIGHRIDAVYGLAREGWRVEAGIQRVPTDDGWTRTNAAWTGLASIGRRFGGVLSLEAMTVDAKGSGLYEADLIRLGGHRSLPGYREDQFRVSRVLMAGAEIRTFLDSGVWASGFTRAGIAWLPDAFNAGSEAMFDPDVAERINLLSYGIKVSMPSRAGRIDFAVAFSEGDSFGQGKFHITFHP